MFRWSLELTILLMRVEYRNSIHLQNSVISKEISHSIDSNQDRIIQVECPATCSSYEYAMTFTAAHSL